MKDIEQTLDSREVAEMVGKEHKQLLKDIRRYIKQFNENNIAPVDFNGGKISPVDFFKESGYTDTKGETRPCYLITKKGCEFIAHKLTGTKGTVFTVRYINRFHEMEDAIAGQAAVQVQGDRQIAELMAAVEAQGKMLKSINGKLSAGRMIGAYSGNGKDRYRGEIIRIIESMHSEEALCRVYTFAKYVPQ